MSGTTLFILEDACYFPALKQRLEKTPEQNIRILVPASLESSLPQEFQDYVLPIASLSQQEKIQIDEIGTRLAKAWPFLDPVQRSTEYRGINLADLVTHGMDYFWIWVIKHVVILQKIWSQCRPAKVVLGYGPLFRGPLHAPCESYYASIAHQMAEKEKIGIEEWPLERVPVSTEKPMPRFASTLYRLTGFLARILDRVFLRQDTRPVLGMLASLRVGEKLLDQTGKKSEFQWIYLTEKESPKVALKLLLKGMRVRALFESGRGSGEVRFSWSELKEQICREKLFEFEGISLLKLADSRLNYLFQHTFPELAGRIDQLFQFFKNYPIHLLVLDEDVTIYHKMIVEMAGQFQIRSVVVQHAITGQERGYVPFSASRIAAWGEISKAQLIEWGVPADSISVTGFPGIQPSQPAAEAERRKILKRLGLDPAKRVLFYAPSRIQNQEHGTLSVKLNRQEHFEFLFTILKAFSALPHCSFVIKAHPGNFVKDFEQLLLEAGVLANPSIRIVDHYNLNEILSVTDVLINFSSTVSIEALAWDIPVVDANFFNKISYIPFGENPPVYQVRRKDELLPALQRALAQPSELSESRRHYLTRYCGPRDGRSVQRILQVLKEEMSRSSSFQPAGILTPDFSDLEVHLPKSAFIKGI